MKAIRMLLGIGLLQLLACCNGHTQTASTRSTKTEAQTNRVGGECEAGYCDLLYVGMPKEINSTDTSAGWYEKGEKLIIKGSVYQLDGKTPAPNVIVYYHQTDNDGYYSPGNVKPENQTRHGHLRGWIKTDERGKYTIHTIRPAPYPNRNNPAHVHFIIKEPDIKNEYWIDDLLFDDDKLLKPFITSHPPINRAGSGIVRISVKGDVQIAEHEIVLGMNIPNYPKK